MAPKSISEPESSEVGFDGLVGPTHNYAGLSYGNVASTSNKSAASSPLAAVLQGLEKMKRLSELGLRQAVLPPQERPYVPVLRQLGYAGSDAAMVEKAAADEPELLAAISSASGMWTANAATVSPRADTADGKTHFTAANLASKFHRSLEAPMTSRILRAIFGDPHYFAHHDPLPGGTTFGDEGAANHTRLCARYGDKGIEFFVHGRRAFGAAPAEARRFPARQTLEASRAVARRHGLDENAVVHAQQSPRAIDAGVFHNDVAGVGNQDVYFYHEEAYVDSERVIAELKRKFRSLTGGELRTLAVPASQVSLEEAVKSYLFNSQLVTRPAGGMALILPTECQENPAVSRCLESLFRDSTQPIREGIFLDLRQSMRNGGGPACLRLRVVLSEAEAAAANPRVFFNADLYGKLTAWARKHYRDELKPSDLADPALLRESRTALDELTRILGLGSIYSFQA